MQAKPQALAFIPVGFQEVFGANVKPWAPKHDVSDHLCQGSFFFWITYMLVSFIVTIYQLVKKKTYMLDIRNVALLIVQYVEYRDKI